jgi:catechol-2,3-dioxygenase
MSGGVRWLALEVKYLDRSQAFYEAFLDLDLRREHEHEVAFAVGETELVLRAPGPVPRGGLHTHYALSIPSAEYDDWSDRLAESFDITEHTFGDARSLYFYDPDGHCVELGQRAVSGPGIDGLFEVVLEVETLDRALEFYEPLGFEPVDYGDGRRRVRTTNGSLELELWEPQLGLADARGGVHVDFGLEVPDPQAAAESVREQALALEDIDDGVRVRGPDGHSVSLLG